MTLRSKLTALAAAALTAGAVPMVGLDAASAASLTVTVESETVFQQVFGSIFQSTAPFDLVDYFEVGTAPGQVAGAASLEDGIASSSVTTIATLAADKRSGSGSITTLNDYTPDPDLDGSTFAAAVYRIALIADQQAFFDFSYAFDVEGALPDVITEASYAFTTGTQLDPVALALGRGSFRIGLDANTPYLIQFSLLADHFRQSGDTSPRLTSQARLTFDYVISPVEAAIPEPHQWALMIAGFGLAGTAVRRRGTAQVRDRIA